MNGFLADYRERLRSHAQRFLVIFLVCFLVVTWFHWSSSDQTPRASFQFEKRENPFRYDISTDGRFAFSWSSFPDMEMPRFRVWDANSTGELRELWSTQFGESDVVVPSPDLSTLAFFDAYPQPKLVLLNSEDGKPTAEWISPHQPSKESLIPVAHQMVWSPAGTHLAVFGQEHGPVGTRMYILSVPELRLEIEMQNSAQPAFSPDGAFVVVQELGAPEKIETTSGMQQSRIGWSIWNLRTRRKQSFIRESALGELALPARDAMTLVIGDNPDDTGSSVPGIRLVDPLNGEQVAELPEARLTSLSHDGNWILTSEGDGIPVVRDALTGGERWRGTRTSMQILGTYPTAGERFPFIQLIDVDSKNGRLVLRTMDEGRDVQRLPPGQFGRLKFSTDFTRMVELIRRHDSNVSRKGKRIAVFDLPPATNWPRVLWWSLTIAFSTAVVAEIAWQLFVWRMDGDPLFPGWN